MKIDLAARTLFSEFQEIVFSRTAIERKLIETPTFVTKTVKGKRYWYKQIYADGQAKQSYFSPATEENNKKIKGERERVNKEKVLLGELTAQEQRLAAMLHKGGLPMLDRRSAVVIGKLSEALLADQCGILIGTLAFTAYSGMLGVIFDKADLKTQDIDIVRGGQIEIASAKTLNAADFFSQPFLECTAVPSLSFKTLPSSFITKDGIRIDLLTPLSGREKKDVRMPKVMGAGATALRFLDFLIEDPVRSVLLSPSRGITVLVPSPSRFAIHKLIVASYRPSTELAKKRKDLHQASQLIAALADEDPAQLRDAYNLACKQGKKWRVAIKNSMSNLPQEILCRLV